MNLAQKQAALAEMAVIEAELERRSKYKINSYFPDTGPLRRSLYTRALEFFEGGVRYPERLLLGGNRTGKTEAAAYEVTCHLTGEYPPWWVGRRFEEPVNIWTAGDTATTTRDIQQLSLYGAVPSAPRTGMIPAHLIKHASPKNSIPNGIENIAVRWRGTDVCSTIQFKSYDQRRTAFQGTAKHVIWLDEECPEDIYTECLLRTLTCNGIVITTFTPVEGLTLFVQAFLERAVIRHEETTETGDVIMVADTAESRVFESVTDEAERVAEIKEAAQEAEVGANSTPETSTRVPLDERQKLIVMIAWDEVPHLSPQARAQMMGEIPPYQRNARMRGIPNLGAGVIYPIPEEEICVKPFAIPEHWPRGYGMDVGWNWTVALHGAYDRETGTWYFYREHYRSHAEPPVHAAGIMAAGAWIPGRIDPAANGRAQKDGTQLLQNYKDLGLNLDMAPNGVEAGIELVWTALTSGRIKVFSHLRNFFTEYRMYRRDAKGRVVKKNDHLMDAMRYHVASGIEWLEIRGHAQSNRESEGSQNSPLSWMG